MCSVAKAVTDYLTPLILDVVLDTEHLGCELCDVLAIPNSLDPNLKKPTNEVVSLHCIKANGYVITNRKELIGILEDFFLQRYSGFISIRFVRFQYKPSGKIEPNCQFNIGFTRLY